MIKLGGWVVACVLASSAVWADESAHKQLHAELDVSYSEANPDYKPFTNGEGETLHARVMWQQWHGFVRYANAEFQPSGEVAGGTIKDWWAVGGAYEHRFSSQWSALVGASLQGLTRVTGAQEEDEDGYEVALGARWQMLDSLRLGVDVGVMDLVIDDWSLNAELRYEVSEPVYVVARLRDYADFDLTYYEAGLGLRF